MPVYLALALVSAATLMYEIALTRLLSVVAWYYLAFVSISTAMLGLTIGALTVQLHPTRFPAERLRGQLGQAALSMGLALPACLIGILAVPVELSRALQTFFSFVLFCAIAAVPFFFSGVFVCLALTRGGVHLGRLYAADLGGAGTGAAAGVLVLQAMDACSAIILVGGLSVLAAALLEPKASARQRRLFLGALGLAAAAGLNSTTVHGIQPIWSKGRLDERSGILVEQWNAISRVRAYRPVAGMPTMWGASPVTPAFNVRMAHIEIDTDAGTTAYAYGGDPRQLAFLAYDVTSAGALLRSGSGEAAIIGVGGGRDVLAAHAAGFRRVTGLEVNGAVLQVLRSQLRDFVNLHRIPGVELHEAEARSWLERTDRRFDLIQASMVDTWAATSAGAMSLTENGLYTVEAWRLFLERLNPTGVICFSRWFMEDIRYETPRLLSLAAAALIERGVKEPSRHVAVIASPRVATILVGRESFGTADLERLDGLVSQMQFSWVARPGSPPHAVAQRVLAAHSVAELDALDDGVFSYAPTRDRSPFFFNALRLLRLRQALSLDLIGNARALLVLLCFFAAALVLAAAAILWPAWRTSGLDLVGLGAGAHVALIGLAFMLVEMGAMLQLSLLLGHPAYSLVLVLGTLLVAGGLGSLLSERLPARGAWRVVPAVLSGAVVLGYAAFAQGLVARSMGASLPSRVGIAVLLLFPLGLAMGGCLPMALRSARAAALESRLPWLWATNGAASVVATFVAVLLAMETSIPATITSGGLAYLVAAGLAPGRSAPSATANEP